MAKTELMKKKMLMEQVEKRQVEKNEKTSTAQAAPSERKSPLAAYEAATNRTELLL